ncbi:unnamed protein product [Miscanthus lutarioriparius]|uniref:non-specific serine/threonine protein kinase n=1 Tax=Miscanthus lutarioriparius TaxID=422564 RepID=A0A811NB23_9POAL|nr:unnamed protein product [Miscanthus lutarioriparius]
MLPLLVLLTGPAAAPTVSAASLFGIADYTKLLPYNPDIADPNYIVTGYRVIVPFPCSCLGLPADPASTFLAGSFPYTLSGGGETYGDVASEFANLTTASWLAATNAEPAGKLPAAGKINVTVNCSCGDRSVSRRYGLFLTYPLWEGETFSSVAEHYGFSSRAQLELLRRFNPGMDGASGKGIVFIPVKGKASQADGMKVDRSIEFSYEELSDATNNFSMEHKIGQGGFGSVYYAELRGEKAAIKKMDTKASQEFLAELKVLTCVHHSNLVRLIGYCVESCLFLVYEFIENGNLSQHLHGTGYEPLSWTSRVQIALDSARGLEYIHEHTVPVYVHRDIKSANILIDKDFRAKVADFGLTKLSEIGTTATSQSLPSLRVVGTFGYMPPEYARYGEVSPKVDVYAFDIVLYELLSAKEAIVRSTEFTDAQGLAYLFEEEALSMPNPKEALQELIDPRLGGDYPIDSVVKIAYLAKSCTHEEPRMRPTMRSVVVALMALSSKDHELTRGQD